MNSYKLYLMELEYRFTKIVVFWNWYDDAIEYVTPQLCSIFLFVFYVAFNIQGYTCIRGPHDRVFNVVSQ